MWELGHPSRGVGATVRMGPMGQPTKGPTPNHKLVNALSKFAVLEHLTQSYNIYQYKISKYFDAMMTSRLQALAVGLPGCCRLHIRTVLLVIKPNGLGLLLSRLLVSGEYG